MTGREAHKCTPAIVPTLLAPFPWVTETWDPFHMERWAQPAVWDILICYHQEDWRDHLKSTNLSLHAWPQTSPRLPLGTFSSRSAVSAPSKEPFCCHSRWKLVLIGTHFTYSALSCYASTEDEALAVAVNLDKANFFVLGCGNFIIAVNHKPLLKAISDWSLDKISNGRLRNLKKTFRYKFHMAHTLAYHTNPSHGTQLTSQTLP